MRCTKTRKLEKFTVLPLQASLPPLPDYSALSEVHLELFSALQLGMKTQATHKQKITL